MRAANEVCTNLPLPFSEPPHAPQLYSYGKGDDTSQWTTTAISLLLWQIADLGEWFQTFSIAHSNVLDPLPLATNETYNADSVFAGYIEQMLDVVITGWRAEGRMQGTGASCARMTRPCSRRCPPPPP